MDEEGGMEGGNEGDRHLVVTQEVDAVPRMGGRGGGCDGWAEGIMDDDPEHVG